MSDQNPWADNWKNVQQQLLESWGEAAPDNTTSNHPGEFWAKGMENWWQSIAPKANNLAKELYERMLNMGKGYFTMAESIGAEDEGVSLAAVNEWLENMQRLLMQFTDNTNVDTDKNSKNFMAFFDMPMDTMNKTFSSMSPFPGDFMESVHAHEAARTTDKFREQLTQFLSTPALGYTRESQEEAQRLSQLMMKYQSAMQAYKLAFARVGVQSIQAFEEKMKTISDGEDDKIDSLRRYYDLWVDECETVYADFASSDEYQSLYGNLVNTQMEVKQHVGMMTDQMLEALNIPSRMEINTLQKRMQEQRREMHALRAEINALKKASQPATTKMPAKKKTSVKKAPVKKSSRKQSVSLKSNPKGGHKK